MVISEVLNLNLHRFFFFTLVNCIDESKIVFF